ncbi:hypothetical protein F5146DRAFT_1198332 [Armillaria mellea]|nr:hypothetical protein F5146DRAFT_1198332 [Armillaria mellea]
MPISSKGKGKAVDSDAQPYDNDNLPWVEKYCPVTLNDVVSHPPNASSKAL